MGRTTCDACGQDRGSCRCEKHAADKRMLRAEVDELRAERDSIVSTAQAELDKAGVEGAMLPARINRLAGQRDELLGLLREFAHGDLAGEWVDTFKERLAAALARYEEADDGE